jgi:hypothetical protein
MLAMNWSVSRIRKPAASVAVAAVAMLIASPSATAQSAAASHGLAAWTSFEGCSAPTNVGGRRLYLDPTQGGVGGDGSVRRPWPGLQATLSAHQVDIRAGDTLVLMSGDHGDVALKSDNTAYIRVEASPGATPVLRHAWISGGKWLLSGLTFKNDKKGSLLEVHGGHDIVVQNSRFLSAEDAGAWNPQELADKGATGIYTDGRTSERCLTLRDNTIMFVNYGARLTADKTVFAGNTIDRFGGDGIDYHGSDLVISYNKITNAREVHTGEHIDAIQGFSPGGQGWSAGPNSRVTIEGNLVIRQVDPALPYPAGMQGIDAFDGDWTDLRVINNVVVTNSFHGIFYASVHHGLIGNNTVISDEGTTINTPPNAPQPIKISGDRVWIGVGDKTHQGTPSPDGSVRNNSAQSVQLSAAPGAVEADHNIVYHLWSKGERGDPHPLSVTVGEVGDHNRVVSGLTREFVAFDPKRYVFDLHLRPGSAAIGAGSSVLAPNVDIDRTPRIGPIDVGAYAYKGAPR